MNPGQLHWRHAGQRGRMGNAFMGGRNLLERCMGQGGR